jgi:hypothetical protein
MLRICALVAAFTSAACAPRAMPYRFHAPLLGGVSAPEIPARAERVELRSAGARGRPPAWTATREPRPLPPREASPAEQTLLAFVGERHPHRAGAALALDMAEALGAALHPDVRAAADGPALVATAAARDALASGAPVLGDLVVFDGAQDQGPASLVGVVVSRRDDGAVEFVYLGLGVVRRGWLHRDRPSDKRDRQGVVLNTWLRAARGQHRKGLAGELWSTYIRLDRLTR